MKAFARSFIPVWQIVSDVTSATMKAAQEGRMFSEMESKRIYSTYRAEDGASYCYAECGSRLLMFNMPKRFDSWGFDDFGGKFDYSFCVMDDYGNAVEVDPFTYQDKGYRCVLAPDYANPPTEGEPYKYIDVCETVH